MREHKIVRKFNWVNDDLLKDNPRVLGLSLFLADTKEVDDVRRLLGQASQPRLDTWELLINTYLIINDVKYMNLCRLLDRDSVQSFLVTIIPIIYRRLHWYHRCMILVTWEHCVTLLQTRYMRFLYMR